MTALLACISYKREELKSVYMITQLQHLTSPNTNPQASSYSNLKLNLNPHDPQSDFTGVILAAIMGMCVCLTWGSLGRNISLVQATLCPPPYAACLL
jgi:hypothetical protein